MSNPIYTIRFYTYAWDSISKYQPPKCIAGEYAPSPDYEFWSGVPLE